MDYDRIWSAEFAHSHFPSLATGLSSRLFGQWDHQDSEGNQSEGVQWIGDGLFGHPATLGVRNATGRKVLEEQE